MRRPPFKRDDGIHLTKGNERIIKRKKKRERKEKEEYLEGWNVLEAQQQPGAAAFQPVFLLYIILYSNRSKSTSGRSKNADSKREKPVDLTTAEMLVFLVVFFSSSDTSLRFGMKGLCSSVRTLSFYRGGAVGGEGSCIILRSGTRSPRVYTPSFAFFTFFFIPSCFLTSSSRPIV